MKSARPELSSSTSHAEIRRSSRSETGSSSSGIGVFKGWMLLPLRLFLGLTFLYAGIQKVTDPQFFDATSPGFIGKQIAAIALGSPIQDFLTSMVQPNAVTFGWLVIGGEIAIGVGTLLGFLFRPAAFFGLLLSITFMLTASWGIYPYFFGSDIVFIFCWLTVLLTGPLPTGLPSLDGWITRHLFSGQGWAARFISAVLVGNRPVERVEADAIHPSNNSISLAGHRRQARRSFVGGAVTGGITVIGLAALGYVLRVFNLPAQEANAGETSANTSTTETQTGSGGQKGFALALVSAVPQNSALPFTIPSTGDPGILVHLADGKFVAYDAKCTHKHCPVGYDHSTQHLICPCHNATFDPASEASVLRGPAKMPLTSLAVHVDSKTGIVSLTQ
jgi:thiosulfate dehydrogenase [quinone] large subunit